MNEPSPAIERQQRRLAVEETADQLGRDRKAVESKLAESTQAIIDLLPEAQERGVPLDTFAKLVGVSRQTLYHWREEAQK
jgi:hypothetical protein